MRVVERMTMTNASFRPCMVHTVGPGRGFRWAAGFTRNVTSVDDAGLKRGKRRRVIWRQAGQHPRNRHRCLQKTRRRTFASGSYTTSLGSSRHRRAHEGKRSQERGGYGLHDDFSLLTCLRVGSSRLEVQGERDPSGATLQTFFQTNASSQKSTGAS